MNNETYIEQFEKQVNLLDSANCKKIIPKMKNKHLNALAKNKKQSGAYVVIDDQSNFVLMFFYHVNNGIKAAQYVVGKDVLPDGALILSNMFAGYILKIMKLAKVDNKHSLFELGAFYAKQISGYKEFLTKQKQ